MSTLLGLEVLTWSSEKPFQPRLSEAWLPQSTGFEFLSVSHGKLSQHLRLFSKPTKVPKYLQPATNVKIML